MAKMSRENMKGHVAFGGLDRDFVKINDHKNTFHVVYDLSIPGFLPRQFVTRDVWKWAADKMVLTSVTDSIKHVDFPERKGYLRASSTATMTYEQEAEVGEIPQTKVTYTQQLDLGGIIPGWVQNRQGVSTLMYVIEHASSSDGARERRSATEELKAVVGAKTRLAKKHASEEARQKSSRRSSARRRIARRSA
jgi:hypothetical protein